MDRDSTVARNCWISMGLSRRPGISSPALTCARCRGSARLGAEDARRWRRRASRRAGAARSGSGRHLRASSVTAAHVRRAATSTGSRRRVALAFAHALRGFAASALRDRSKRAGGGAAQRRQVGAAAERLADVFAERADVGALAARCTSMRQQSLRPLDERRSAMDRHVARLRARLRCRRARTRRAALPSFFSALCIGGSWRDRRR